MKVLIATAVSAFTILLLGLSLHAASQPNYSDRDDSEFKVKVTSPKANLKVKDGQRFECIKETSFYVTMQDCERLLEPKRGRAEDNLFYSRLTEVVVPKGMIVTTIRSRAYRGSTITKLHLEEPIPSHKVLDRFSNNTGPSYSDVWGINFAKLIGHHFKAFR